MRAIVVAIVAIQIGSGHLACADNSPASDRSIRETLPLFEKNHCAAFAHPAEQLFCGDPELNDAAARLNGAIQDRLDRLPNRSLAIEENAEWIADRNSSCGIFAAQNISSQDVKSIKTCLLKETEERTAILSDPNFDCLATNTAAGMLICSDPSLATAKTELNSHVLGLIAKLKGDEAKAAFAEYERWSRDRDRRCNLTDKENVPLEELSPSESCLAEYISRKTAEMVVLSPFAVCSPIASGCTGRCWDLRSGKAKPLQESRDSFSVAHKLRIEKTFAFQKTDSGGWRCNTPALEPIEVGVALGGP